MSGYVDLHVHSCASDGTMTASEIVESARAHGVDLLAISDHNTAQASRELMQNAPEGLCCIPSVEIDCLAVEAKLHVHGYGIDLDHPGLEALIARNRRELDAMSERLVAALGLSLSEFQAFSYDRRKGGWAGLHFLHEKGVVADPFDAADLYNRYDGCGYDSAAFPPFEEVAAMIHAAGGKAVLAHPGYSLRRLPLPLLVDFLEQLIPKGLDGLECYYPGTPAGRTEACLAVCQAHGLLITTGSDDHGAFLEDKPGIVNVGIGGLRIRRDALRLTGIRSSCGVL
ncbi:MAG TPA: PHP domain-containing protein [Clostridia bacterium]|nr:PHP domain-containing protein [Clostridia bacterium]